MRCEQKERNGTDDSQCLNTGIKVIYTVKHLLSTCVSISNNRVVGGRDASNMSINMFNIVQ